MKKILFALLLTISPALAQQQELSPAEIAIQLNGVINSWAQTIAQQNKTIAELQKQLAAAKANKEPEPPKEPK